jgi:hypothetical protein
MGAVLKGAAKIIGTQAARAFLVGKLAKKQLENKLKL